MPNAFEIASVSFLFGNQFLRDFFYGLARRPGYMILMSNSSLPN